MDDPDCPFAGLHPSSQLCEATQSCKRAIRLANQRQVLAQDAVSGGVNGLVAATGLLDESLERLGLKLYQSVHLRQRYPLRMATNPSTQQVETLSSTRHAHHEPSGASTELAVD